MLLRRGRDREFLSGMRRKEARGFDLDVFLRRGEQRQVLHFLRRQKARDRSMRKLRLETRRPDTGTEILSRMRNPVQ